MMALFTEKPEKGTTEKGFSHTSRYCPQCGKLSKNMLESCPYCGHKLATSAAMQKEDGANRREKWVTWVREKWATWVCIIIGAVLLFSSSMNPGFLLVFAIYVLLLGLIWRTLFPGVPFVSWRKNPLVWVCIAIYVLLILFIHPLLFVVLVVVGIFGLICYGFLRLVGAFLGGLQKRYHQVQPPHYPSRFGYRAPGSRKQGFGPPRAQSDRFISQDVVREVYRRDRYSCQKCGATKSSTRLIMHHVAPVRHGGPNTADNLVLLCVRCHREEHHNMWK